ncbi:PIN domain-containing protein [Candidatus Woesearchaeota archaeon]|nr:PIN domain-containing protein [Candidatus Woesearchaeota archaeon]
MIVINTSSSLFISRLGLFPSLLKRFKAITTPEIAQEVREGKEIGYKDARIVADYLDRGQIEIQKAKGINEVIKEFSLHPADASVVALAHESGCSLATEDRQIERVCLIGQIGVTNTPLLIHSLWKKKVFAGDQALLLLDLLLRMGYNKSIIQLVKGNIR